MSSDIRTKAVAIEKATYLHSLGYNMNWASFHVVELMSTDNVKYKRVGYLAATQSFGDDTDVVLLYLESFGNPRKFARVARRVSRSKPVVAVKAGRSRAGTHAASTHTAALASDETAVDVVRGLIRDVGLAPCHVGPLQSARYLEPLAAMWIMEFRVRRPGSDYAFRLIDRQGNPAP